MVRKPADGRAYAMVVAEAHGLTYEAVRARFQACIITSLEPLCAMIGT